MKSIVFIALLVMRIIQGLKTQTRRIINHPLDGRGPRWGPDGWEDYHGKKIKCPYKVGDRLYVREEHYMFGEWVEKEGEFTRFGRPKKQFIHFSDTQVLYSDSPPDIVRKAPHTAGWYKRLSRFMPYKASRITLEVTNVRAERVQDISEADALAEGIRIEICKTTGRMSFCAFESDKHKTVRDAFFYLWNIVHSPNILDPNGSTWVWVFDFKVVEIKKGPIFL